jgi:hypothetical protein
MTRGTVVALNKRTAVVLMPDGQFIRVKRMAQFVVGEEIYDHTAVRSVPRIRQRLLQTGAFASVILLVLFGFLLFRTPPVVAYVTMDINPSIELGLDSKERVRELRAVNEDAQEIIAGMKYRGQNLESVMNELARKLVDQHILTLDDGEIVIASVPVRVVEEQWEIRVAEKMKQILTEATKRENPEQLETLDVTTVFLPEEVRDEAEANGVSSGKMAFWLISRSQGHELTLETLKSQSLKKIAASWGGVNKVMSKYEQKNVDNSNKEKSDSQDRNKDTQNNDKEVKGNKDDKGKNDDNKKVDKSTDPKHNGQKGDDNQKKNNNQKKDDNNSPVKEKDKNDDKQKSWESLLDEAKQKQKHGNSTESDKTREPDKTDDKERSKSSDRSEHSDKKNDR